MSSSCPHHDDQEAAPGGGFAVETRALRETAAAWQATVAPKLAAARQGISAGLDGGALFGIALAPLAEHHTDFVERMILALSTGETSAKAVAAALRSAADHYDRVDADVAAALDKRAKAVSA